MHSVVIKSADREKISKAVYSYAALLRKEHPEIERIIWFGSWVNGLPSAGSDVDLCLVITSSNKPFRDRISEYLPVGFPVGVDLFVYTSSEFEQLAQISPGWYSEIMRGRWLKGEF